jgi:hypothetical protein
MMVVTMLMMTVPLYFETRNKQGILMNQFNTTVKGISCTEQQYFFLATVVLWLISLENLNLLLISVYICSTTESLFYPSY